MDIIDRLREQRDQELAEGQAILDLSETEDRDITEFELWLVAEHRHNAAEYEARAVYIRDTKADMAAIAEARKDVEDQVRPNVQVRSEPHTYRKGGPQSYFRDLVAAALPEGSMVSVTPGEARERLVQHAREVEVESRDLNRTDGTGGYAVPPLYLMNEYIELARSKRVFADRLAGMNLPGGTDSIRIPKMLTGTAVSVQTGDNQVVAETDLTDTEVVAPVRTAAGQQDLAIQLIDQSPIAFDQIVFRDLIGAHASYIDAQCLAGSGSTGQVLGLLGVTQNTVAVTVSSTTLAGSYAKIADAVQQIHTNRFDSPTAIVVHPRRWGQWLSSVDGSNRPLIVPSAQEPQNAAAGFGGVAAEGFVGNLQGLPVYVDANVSTAQGASTNQDVVIVGKMDDGYLWESPIRSRVLSEVGSGTLTVRLQIFNYFALQLERYSKSFGIIGGTGYVPPTF